jgi:hypothetical protein
MNELMAQHSGQPLSNRLSVDTERDRFLSAEEAVEYGLVDAILTHRELMRTQACRDTRYPWVSRPLAEANGRGEYETFDTSRRRQSVAAAVRDSESDAGRRLVARMILCNTNVAGTTRCRDLRLRMAFASSRAAKSNRKEVFTHDR